MTSEHDIKELILKAMDKQEIPRSTSNQMILGALDSIGLVNFVMDLEEDLLEAGIKVKLVSDKAFGKSSPFATVSTLYQHIKESWACQENTTSSQAEHQG
jgi:acyl carrier protein